MYAGIRLPSSCCIRLDVQHRKDGIGIDTGSQHIGVGVTCGDRVILKEEHELRSSMEKRSLLVTRAAMRRGRRYRKVRYRKPKWRQHTKRMYFEKPNRRGQHWRKVKTTTQSPRPKGWLPPSCSRSVTIISVSLTGI